MNRTWVTTTLVLMLMTMQSVAESCPGGCVLWRRDGGQGGGLASCHHAQASPNRASPSSFSFCPWRQPTPPRNRTGRPQIRMPGLDMRELCALSWERLAGTVRCWQTECGGPTCLLGSAAVWLAGRQVDAAAAGDWETCSCTTLTTHQWLEVKQMWPLWAKIVSKRKQQSACGMGRAWNLLSGRDLQVQQFWQHSLLLRPFWQPTPCGHLVVVRVDGS